MPLDPDNIPPDFNYRYTPLGELKELIEAVRDRQEDPSRGGICDAIPGMDRIGLKIVADIMDIRLPEVKTGRPKKDEGDRR